MARSATERHAKQKAKLDLKSNKPDDTTPAYIPKPNLKNTLYEEITTTTGYSCELTQDSVLMFYDVDASEVTDWLLKKCGREENGSIKIPFSFGFASRQNKERNSNNVFYNQENQKVDY